MVTGAEVEEAVIRDKRREIEAGVDGFLIYDLALAAPCRRLWAEMKGKTRGQQQRVLNEFEFQTRPGVDRVKPEPMGF